MSRQRRRSAHTHNSPSGGLGLRPLGGGEFELEHPRCVMDRELDYAEGIELWKAGDPEAARDALRFALDGCGDNLWVHVALGRIALESYRDPALARGHLGYAVQMVQRVLPCGFRGRLPGEQPANQPFFDALEGLAACHDALQQTAEAARLRSWSERLKGRRKSTGTSSAGDRKDRLPDRGESPSELPEGEP